MKNWLLVIIGAFLISVGLCSCTEEKEGDTLYSIGIESFESSSSNVMMEIGRANDAFVEEFGGETFILGGDKSKNDKDVAERFNKVAKSYKLDPDFKGYFEYVITRDGETIASYRFENKN